jgi:hypothetical protein
MHTRQLKNAKTIMRGKRAIWPKKLLINVTALILLVITTAVPAQVLKQKTLELDGGFKAIEEAQINVAGRWHSDQKFYFLYHEKRHLCQCSNYSISPSGRVAIFQESSSGEILNFGTKKKLKTVFNKVPKGTLKSVSWSKNEKSAELAILISKNMPEEIVMHRVKLK